MTAVPALKTDRPPGYVFTNSDSMATARAELDAWIYWQTDGVVQTGPFAGMRLSDKSAWPDTRLSPKLLGCYEEELHGALERQIDRLKGVEAPRIAVVGCAEGYYAVGLKRRLPEATVFIVDNDEKAIVTSNKNAVLNDVDVVSGADLNEVFDRLDLIVMDCEGAEVAYLDPARWPQLYSSHIVVEIHNIGDQKTDAILLDRFRGSHRINLLFEGPRNPTNYKLLPQMVSDYRWMAVSEGRPCLMGWFVMEPKGLHVV